MLLAFFWVKREDLGRILNSSLLPKGRALKRLRAGPVEVEWDQLIETTAEEVSEIPSGVSPSAVGLPKVLHTAARSVPTAAVLEAFARLEMRLREIYDQVNTADPAYTGKLRFSSARQIIDRLSQEEVISPKVRTIVLNLNQLRNEAAHRVGETDINSRQAAEYLKLVDSVLSYLSLISIDNRLAG
jgi:hypothetical protein